MNAKFKEQMDAAIYCALTRSRSSFGGYGQNSYLLSYEGGKFTFSLGSISGKPDKKIEKYIETILGEPTRKYNEMSNITFGLRLYYMVWESIEFNPLKNQSKTVYH